MVSGEANGADNFGAMLITVMQEHNLTQLELARRLDCSQAAVGRWIRGKPPRDLMRAKVLAKLREPPPKPSPAGQRFVMPRELAPIKVVITGEGVDLTMQVSPATARRLFQVLLTDNQPNE